VGAIRRWLTGTFTGRLLAIGAGAKLLALLVRALRPSRVVEALDTVADVTLVVALLLLAFRLYRDVKGVLLWRVRRRLTVSYIFIGFVPVLLIIILFLTAGLILFFNVSQYVARGAVTTLTEQAFFLAESAAVGLEGASTGREVAARIQRRQAGAQRIFPYVFYAIVPSGEMCSTVAESPLLDGVTTVGPWTHMNPPTSIPDWVPCTGASGLFVYTTTRRGSDAEVAHVAARAVAWPDDPELPFAVVVDVPFSAALVRNVWEETGIEIGSVSPQPDCPARPLQGREFESMPETSAIQASGLNPLTTQRNWVTFLEYVDWGSGDVCQASMQIRMTMADLYSRIAGSPLEAADGMSPGQVLLLALAIVVVLFLIIEIVALVMGLALARSITGAVHELAVGTERIREADFTYKIPIRSRDQLGELAESFNSMTASVLELLQQKAEKERMEQELRIARSIQMSLLPQGGISFPGIVLDAHCEPAREVGGDYYDYFPIDDHRLGLLIADVAGKGTSAALYMAELKGLMLSLSQHHTSPRLLLIDANRIISRHLDSRSFITITYAVVDLQAKTLTYSRAGHCPLIYVPGPYASSRAAQILTPDGLVLGLQIDDGTRFNALLAEVTLPLGPGDLFLFYTDGLTDAMDPAGNCFGDPRLAGLMQEHADLPFAELRERILAEIAIFSGTAVQHDDMTMLLLKVEGMGARVVDERQEAAAGAAVPPFESAAGAAVARPGLWADR
jgi:sigma-B regulation protein RsbU (phosphoserine phosphatase)